MENTRIVHELQSESTRIPRPRSVRIHLWVRSLSVFPRGVTLLLVILILTALLSISISIFGIVFGEIRISGDLVSSFVAFYGADQALEYKLYDDRSDGTPVCAAGNCTVTETLTTADGLPADVCVNLIFTRAGNTSIIATGQYRCSDPLLAVKRAFLVTY